MLFPFGVAVLLGVPEHDEADAFAVIASRVQQPMNDPDGELYKKCIEQLNDFEKRLALKGGKAFEVSMRRAFEQAVETDVP